jgi:hypothetical protein
VKRDLGPVFKITEQAVYGDSINGRESQRGEFLFDGTWFQSLLPVSREEARRINSAMKGLEKNR